MQQTAEAAGSPISVDNGPKLAGRALDERSRRHGVTLQFIRPGKLVENA